MSILSNWADKHLLANTAARRSRRAGRNVIKKQKALVSGRIPGINAYFDSLLGRAEEDTALKERGLLDRFLSESHDFRRSSEEAQAKTGFAYSGGLIDQERYGLKNMFKGLGLQRDTLTSDLESQRLQIGQSRENKLQSIQDLLYQLNTNRLAIEQSI